MRSNQENEFNEIKLPPTEVARSANENENLPKIDQYGLQDKVLELRQNLSLEKTAEIINAQYLPDGAEPISHTAIARWERRNNITWDNRDGNRQMILGVPLNPWQELVGLKNRSEKNLQRLNKKIEEIKGDQDRLSEVASISNAYVSAMKTHQGIVNDIGKYQKEMLRVDNVRKVVNLMMKILRDEHPEAWNKFITELKKYEEFELMNAL